MKKFTQEDAVRQHLLKYNNITSIEAIMRYGATRLSAIIYNLRRQGLNIVSKYETTQNRYNTHTNYVRYILEEV